MSDGLRSAIRRFPECRKAIEMMVARDEDFRTLCEDLADAEAAQSLWEKSSSPRRDQLLVEIQSLGCRSRHRVEDGSRRGISCAVQARSGRLMLKSTKEHPRRGRQPQFECIALILQGGGALGAYQAGAYEALAEAGLHPDWVAGISQDGVRTLRHPEVLERPANLEGVATFDFTQNDSAGRTADSNLRV